MAYVTPIMAFIDTAVSGTAENVYRTIAGGYGGMITMFATLAFAAFGLSIALGAMTVKASDLTQLVFRIVLIFTFGLSWSNFEAIYDALTNVSDGLVAALFAAADGTGAESATKLADSFADDAQEVAASVIRAESSIVRGILGALMVVLLGALQAAYILIAGFAKMMIGILIGLAPFAIAATCLQRTQFLFEAWLSSLIGYFLYPVAAAGVMGFVATVAKNMFWETDTSALVGITGFFVIIIVGFFALKSIPQIASNITGQLNLGGIAPEALRMVGSPVVKAGQIAKPRAAQFLSGATTGGDTIQNAEFNRRRGSATDLKYATRGAQLANNRLGHFVQRRRDLQFARNSNTRMRLKSRGIDPDAEPTKG